MLFMLPIVTFLLLWLFRRDRMGWRDELLSAATLWAVLAVAINESLSVPGWLTATGISVTWTLILMGIVGYHLAALRRSGRRDMGSLHLPALETIPAECLPMIAACVVILALVGITALLVRLTPPTRCTTTYPASCTGCKITTSGIGRRRT